MHGFMVDSARCLESREYYRRFIRFIAERGADTLLWHFSDDQGCSLRFDALPEAASPNAYSKAEMQELIAFARDHGILLIPELASLGHTRYITGLPQYADLTESDDFFSSMCPTDPRTHQIMARLLDEVIETFDSPLVHIGCDEVNIGHHPRTRKALQDRTTGDLFAEHVNRMHDQLKAAGRRTMMWADQLLADPSIAPQLSRDILLCNWQYAPKTTTESTQQLLDWGFEVVVCPALISHNQPVYPGETFALPNVRVISQHRNLGPGVLGMITTIWTPTRFLPDTLWPAVHYAAAVTTEGEKVDPRDALADFARRFHDMEPTDIWLDAMVALQTHAPHRNDWAPVARLDADLKTDPAILQETATIYHRIHDSLLAARQLVKSNMSSYNRLLLLTDVLAHVWKRAAAWRSAGVSPSVLHRSEHLQERLSQAWDEDRYADDPRKHDCSQLYDSADHLLIAFDEGTQVIRKTQQAAGTGYISGMAGH